MLRAVIANNSKIKIGPNSKVMFYSQINAGADIEIGSFSAISSHSTLTSSTHLYGIGKKFLETKYTHKKIIIGDNVHVGIGTFVSPGTKISSNVIIGPLSYVNKDLDKSDSYYNGNPIKFIYHLGKNS